jgi:hypothetical protein
MGEAVEETGATLLRIQSSLDLLHGVVANIDTEQKQMRAQLDHQAAAIADSNNKHDDTTRILAGLMDKLHILERAADDKAARSDSPADPTRAAATGLSVVHPVMPQWTGNAPGASTSSAPRMSGVQIDPGGDGILGGGGHGGVGGGRSGAPNQDMAGRAPMPKMPFPRFDGVHPRVWRDKCHDYFRAFNISPTLWVTTATLHMDGNAAIWLQAFRQRHALGPWPTFIAAVESEFGADDQR